MEINYRPLWAMLALVLVSACASRPPVPPPPPPPPYVQPPPPGPPRDVPVVPATIGGGDAPSVRVVKKRRTVQTADRAAFEPSQSLPFCVALGTRATAANCALRKNFGASIKAANIVDTVPDNLTVGQSATFEIAYATLAASADAAAQFGRAEVNVREAVLAPIISAQIYGGGMTFTPAGPVEKRLELSEKLTWNWSAMPATSGAQTVTVRFELKREDGRMIDEFLHKMEVSVAPGAASGSTPGAPTPNIKPQTPGLWDTWLPRAGMIIGVLTGLLTLFGAYRKYWPGKVAATEA